MEKHSTITGEFAYILVTEFGSSPTTYGFHFDIANFLKRWFYDVEAHSNSVRGLYLINFKSPLSEPALTIINYILLKHFKCKLIV
mgnify:CR=1 FL=1